MSSDRENGHDQTENDQLNTKRSMKSDTEIKNKTILAGLHDMFLTVEAEDQY